MTHSLPAPDANPNIPYPPAMAPAVPVFKKRGAWSVWWLCAITLGIYYFVWYQSVNAEISGVLKRAVPGNGKWWSQLIPIYGLVGLAATAKRLNQAHTQVGSPTRVGPVVAWLWAPAWFASQTRYLQRRINILHDVLASHAVRPSI